MVPQVACHLLFLSLGVTPPDESLVPRICTREFDIDYQVNDTALPLTAVGVWYTRDAGVTWHNAGPDPDGQPPAHFTAVEEGLYGFLLVATNEAGASSEPPRSGTEPGHWAFVDYTPPVVQFHPVRPGTDANPRTLQLRWTVIDANLVSRPIEISWRRLPDGPWQTVASAVSNSGRYDWRLVEGLRGIIMVRISARDRGGNQSEAAAGAVDLDAIFASRGPAETTRPATARATTRPAPTEKELTRAHHLHEQAVAYLGRGEYRLAISRLRDALGLDPSLSPALVDMGRALYAVGDYEESANSYELALTRDPKLRSAFSGLAESCAAARKYDEAARYLRELLQLEPKDARAWLNLGDVQMWRGDEVGARASYQNASTFDPNAADVVARAKLRLDNLDLVRRRVGRLVPTAEPVSP